MTQNHTQELREGGLKAPVRHPHHWNDKQYHDQKNLEDEMTRVFDVCHGCRRCLSLCDSFPQLFNLVDNAPSGELDSVDKRQYHKVADACTLCDMCFMVSCPYVPPHEFNIDFPHLITRFRAASKSPEPKGKTLTFIDRNAKLAILAPQIVNWASSRKNKPTRWILKQFFGVHPDAELPKYATPRFVARANKITKNNKTTAAVSTVSTAATAIPSTHGADLDDKNQNTQAIQTNKPRKVVVYATCFVENHHTETGHAAMAILKANDVETVPLYPGCCGMPKLERADLKAVAKQAQKITRELLVWIEKGYEVVALTPSCALMLKFEWPQILPNDPAVQKVAAATFDAAEYIIALHRAKQLKTKAQPLEGGIFLHVACHARAQNVGFKARDLLKLIPDTELQFAARCSGHGGLWGMLEENFETAHKIGKPVAQHINRAQMKHLSSECPLAGMHLVQGVEKLNHNNHETNHEAQNPPAQAKHPIVLYAEACGLSF